MISKFAAAALCGLMVMAAGQAAAQSDPRYVRFTHSATKGALYKPDSGPAPRVGVLVIHRTSNFMNHISTTELSARGFLVLGMNPRSDNNEAAVDWELLALDVREGVEYLKKQPGIQKVVLLGHSGGGPTTSFYQAVAENGVGFCKGPNKLTECPDRIAGGPPADGLILVDAHPGNSVNGLRGLNPAVLDERDPRKIDPALDPFAPANGFNPNGDSTYSKDFQDRYFRAQAARMNRLIESAQKIRAAQRAGQHVPADDDSFVVYRNRARLSDISRGVHGATEKPHKLLKNDGTIDASKPVQSVRVSTPDNAKRDTSFDDTRQLTIKSFLGANAIKATHSLDGIDWCSSNNSTPCAVQAISVPLLVTAMGGHYFVRDNEIVYDMAKSRDKDYIVVDGATHGMTPCRPCAQATGQSYDNATKNFFDYLAKWMNDRF